MQIRLHDLYHERGSCQSWEATELKETSKITTKGENKGQHKTYFISLITGWTVYTEKYKARGPDV